MILLGAAGGDICGSRFEWNNHRSKDFELFTNNCFITDDTVMTMAVAEAILQTEPSHPEMLAAKTAETMHEYGRMFPGYGYGGRFAQWIQSSDPKPYNSFGNGSAMRVSACGWAGSSAEEVLEMAEQVSKPTHNHPEGIKGAQATALAVYLARTGAEKEAIREAMEGYYDISFTLDDIRDSYRFNETCQQTVPQAIVAFLESESYEDALRGAVSIGGDSDTLAAIAGSIAEAYYGIPEYLQNKILKYFNVPNGNILTDTLSRFNDRYGHAEGKPRN